MGKIIALLNQKGGCAKTTSAALLAYGLAGRGFKVLLLDLDPQRSLSRWMNSNEFNAVTTFELLTGQATAKQATQRLLHCDLIPSKKELASVEPLLPLSGKLKRLKKALAPIKDEYDYIILDSPPSLGILSVNALVAADEVLIPSTATAFSIEGFLDLYQTIKEVQEDDNPDLIVRGVLITMYHNRTVITQALASTIKSLNNKFNVKTFESKIRSSIYIQESQVHRFDPFVKDPTNISVVDFNNFLDEFLGGPENEQE